MYYNINTLMSKYLVNSMMNPKLMDITLILEMKQ